MNLTALCTDLKRGCMEKIRLDKFLSSQLNISRTDAKKLIKSKTVTVNKESVSKAEFSVDTVCDKVCVGGKEISYKKYIYIMLNKPKGVVSASVSETDVTVVDLVSENLKRSGLFPAGRLDKDTTGFVLITDDGEFAHNILSPAHHIEKEYEVTLEREVSAQEAESFSRGINLGDILLKPASLEFLKFNGERENKPQYSIVITEGRYHQIKRMFASVGNKVLELNRIRMGGLMLDNSLAPGECRELLNEEVERIILKKI